MLAVAEVAGDIGHPLLGRGDADAVTGLEDESVGGEEVMIGATHAGGAGVILAPQVEVADCAAVELLLREHHSAEVDIMALLVQADLGEAAKLLDDVVDGTLRPDDEHPVAGLEQGVAARDMDVVVADLVAREEHAPVWRVGQFADGQDVVAGHLDRGIADRVRCRLVDAALGWCAAEGVCRGRQHDDHPACVGQPVGHRRVGCPAHPFHRGSEGGGVGVGAGIQARDRSRRQAEEGTEPPTQPTDRGERPGDERNRLCAGA